MQLRLLAVAALFTASLFAQSPSNHVLAILTVKNEAARDDMKKIMPAEVKATVQLYLDGKISQWFSRGDNKGVMFIMDVKTVEEAKALTDNLPLVKAGYATFEYMPIGPLNPLRYLMQ